ncbi:MAG: Crp/Fnr family transcriptional regulator [Flavipsychrobacter sp.]|nr:Crp/Fnr family transcriptional regulator [Flavipsychrobacter sp.]
MIDDIVKFISGYIPLSPHEIEFIDQQNLIVRSKKNTVLLAEGLQAKECFFVLKGCVRSYHIVDGVERTTAFFTEDQPITPVSYVTGQPSGYFLACVEDAVIALGSHERNRKLIEKIPALASMIMQMNSELLVQQQESFDAYRNLSPEARYLQLMDERPDLLSRVPQYHLASYLGITPESLSRIRRRLMTGTRDPR